jgi:hypothetical protein
MPTSGPPWGIFRPKSNRVNVPRKLPASPYQMAEVSFSTSMTKDFHTPTKTKFPGSNEKPFR